MASAELIRLVNECDSKAINGMVSTEVVEILYDLAKVAIWTEKDVQTGLKITAKAKNYLQKIFDQHKLKIWYVNDIRLKENSKIPEIEIYWRLLLEETPYIFESFMCYMEKNRTYDKKFYEPRRYTKDGRPALKIVANDLQGLMARKFDFYGLSMPSRVGKSTICIFYLAWKALRAPNSHNAMGGHSGTLVKGFYKELLNLLTSSEYTFAEIYNHLHNGHTIIQDKSAEDYTINLDAPDRFATLTCRGIDATWTGAIDVSSDGLLYVDDLVRDRQHSLSPTRMEETWQEYNNKMVDRKNDGAQELMVGTLWNVYDPLERLRVQYIDNPRYFFRRIPALDEHDTSNFDYEKNGFSTQYYVNMRERLDAPEWSAKYQQSPYVREGLLFPINDLNYFNGTLANDPLRCVAICDTAFGGGDSLSMPICVETTDNKKYIVDWLFSTATTKFTVPAIVDKIERHMITELRIERNNGGKMLEEAVKAEMKKRNVIHCKVYSVSAPNGMSKEDKIKGYSDYVKDNFIFLLPKKAVEETEDTIYQRDADYQRAIDELAMYTTQGKNPHDDAPDSMAQLAILFDHGRNGTVEAMHNPFRR